MLLIGDVGGTKTAVAVVSEAGPPCDVIAETTYSSGDYPSLDAIVEEFLEDKKFPIKRAVFGVAGPVVKGEATVTNLPWVVSERLLKEKFRLSSVRLLNDLEAIAYGVPHLAAPDLLTINRGKAEGPGNIAVVAPGTGLGEAFLSWDGARFTVHSSEGGHADFASKNHLEGELLEYLREKFGHVSFERVCSGPGISNIYSFLKESEYGAEPQWLAERLSEVKDPTPEIVDAALDPARPCELCVSTLDVFVSILGSESGNLALKVFATHGVYLGGGIPPRILPFFEKDIFMKAFLDKGRYTDFMERIPVHVIVHPKIALVGAACSAMSE